MARSVVLTCDIVQCFATALHCWFVSLLTLSVASLRLVSPGAVTDGVTLFYLKM